MATDAAPLDLTCSSVQCHGRGGAIARDGFGYLFGCHFFGLLSSIVNN
jgi:hypothetical protein